MSNENHNPQPQATAETSLQDERAIAFAFLPTITMAASDNAPGFFP